MFDIKQNLMPEVIKSLWWKWLQMR